MAAAVVRSLVAVVVLLVAVVLAVAASASAASLGAAGGDHLPLGILASSGGRRECRGTVGECLVGGDDGGEFDGEEGELGSAAAEAHRRVLAGRGRAYISYGALRRDSVPCSRRGASYYNCRPGASANPYHRGCSRITRCRG